MFVRSDTVAVSVDEKERITEDPATYRYVGEEGRLSLAPRRIREDSRRETKPEEEAGDDGHTIAGANEGNREETVPE